MCGENGNCLGAYLGGDGLLRSLLFRPGRRNEDKKKIKPFFFGIVFFFFPFFFRKKGKRKKSNKSHKELLRKFVLQSTCLLTIPKRVSRIVCSDFFILGFFLEKKKRKRYSCSIKFFLNAHVFPRNASLFGGREKSSFVFFSEIYKQKGKHELQVFSETREQKKEYCWFFFFFSEKSNFQTDMKTVHTVFVLKKEKLGTITKLLQKGKVTFDARRRRIKE